MEKMIWRPRLSRAGPRPVSPTRDFKCKRRRPGLPIVALPFSQESVSDSKVKRALLPPAGSLPQRRCMTVSARRPLLPRPNAVPEVVGLGSTPSGRRCQAATTPAKSGATSGVFRACFRRAANALKGPCPNCVSRFSGASYGLAFVVSPKRLGLAYRPIFMQRL